MTLLVNLIHQHASFYAERIILVLVGAVVLPFTDLYVNSRLSVDFWILKLFHSVKKTRSWWNVTL